MLDGKEYFEVFKEFHLHPLRDMQQEHMCCTQNAHHSRVGTCDLKADSTATLRQACQKGAAAGESCKMSIGEQ